MFNLDFNNHVFGIINFLGIKIWLTESLINTWVISFVLCLITLILNIFVIKNFKETPKFLQNILETIIEFVSSIIEKNLDIKSRMMEGYFFGLFIFILFSNLSGLLGLRPPTADFSTCFSFALVTFFLIHTTGIITGKSKYFKSYFEPNFVMLPINLISEIATPISLSFRLFGNMIGGTIIMSMIYKLLPIFLKFWIPGIFHIYFDIFAGIIQSFIFISLSLIFIKNKTYD